MKDWHAAYVKLADSKLTLPLSEKSLERFLTAEDPIAWLIAHNHVHDSVHFYADAAALFGIRYVTDIPVVINNTNSLAYSIGSETLSKLLAYPYKEGDKIIIASSEPSRANELIALCKQKRPSLDNFEVVLAPPNAIRAAISESNYQLSAVNAEEYLDVARPPYSSKGALSRMVRVFLAIIVIIFIIFFFWRPPQGFLIFFIIINTFYLLFNAARLLMAIIPHGQKVAPPDMSTVLGAKSEYLPLYTILVPLKDEAAMVPNLIRRLKDIEYPGEKLDIKIIVEVTDTDTLDALAKENIDGTSAIASRTGLKFHLVRVPVAVLSTKPRSCNYALQFARGDMTVIYDAEDWPDPLQLKKAYALFLHEKLDTLCVQAKLNFYNDRQNILTRFFSLEYSFWYDSFLPGLHSMNIPLPLGGTSNHFLTNTLRKVGAWDPYNVTEDADLGWRLSRLGYRTAVLDSYTLEEASNTVGSWIKQRTRWLKGFLVTSLVHLRSPKKMWRQLGPWGFATSATIFTTTILLPILNPALWVFFVLWYVPPLFGLPSIGFQMPDWIEVVGFINLAVGNGVYIIIHLVDAIKQKRYYLVAVAPFMPLYWLLISVAAYRAVYQTVINPYIWEKTKHGPVSTNSSRTF